MQIEGERIMNEANGIVVFGFGPQEIDFFSKCEKICGKNSVIDPDLARMAGANFAVGQRDALDKLASRLREGALAAQKNETPGLSDAATKWLANGRRGISSNTIFTVLTGIDALRGWEKDHPYDPADLDRCLLLLEAVPELKPEMHRMAQVSKHWAALIKRWDELVECHVTEVGIGWTKAKSAPKTYALMREILDGVTE